MHLRTLRPVAIVFAALLLTGCENPLDTAREEARTKSFTLLLEAVARTADAIRASEGGDVVDTDALLDAFAEFPGNGFETEVSARGVTVNVATGMYAGCSATLLTGTTDVPVDNVVCVDPPGDTSLPQPLN